MKKRIIAAICLVAMLVSMTTMGALHSAAEASIWVDKDMPENLDYSFAVLGDIQSITYFDSHNRTTYLEDMFDWILDNKDERKIEYIFGLGDTVETLTTYPNKNRNPLEWVIARTQFRRLHDKAGNVIIPYMVVRGNHDDEGGYHKYICNEKYQAQMDGFGYDPNRPLTLGNSMSNSYRKIEIGNHKYLMLGLDYNADQAAIAWANQVIEAHPDHKVIVSVHAYLSSTGQTFAGDIGSSNVDNTVLEEIPFNGMKLWTSIFRKHENMFMVLSGHVSVNSPVVSTRTGVNGNEVIEILVDPQAYDWDHGKDVVDEETGAITPGKAGAFVLMLNFTNGGEKLEIEYYSTAYGKFYGAGNQRVMELDEGTLPTFIPPVDTSTTTTTTTTTTTVEDGSKKGCKAAISTTAIACWVGTSLAVFAMRRKEND